MQAECVTPFFVCFQQPPLLSPHRNTPDAINSQSQKTHNIHATLEGLF